MLVLPELITSKLAAAAHILESDGWTEFTEIQTRAAARAAAIAKRGPINEGEDSTDEEDLSDEDGKFYHHSSEFSLIIYL
jgi:hypothetical protein